MASAAAQTGSQPQPLESGRRPVLSQLASSDFNGQLRLRRQPPTGTPSVCAGYPWPSAAGSHPCGRWPARASGGRAGGSELPGGELRRRASQRGGSSGSQASPPLAHAGCTPEGWELRSDPERITAQAQQQPSPSSTERTNAAPAEAYSPRIIHCPRGGCRPRVTTSQRGGSWSAAAADDGWRCCRTADDSSGTALTLRCRQC